MSEVKRGLVQGPNRLYSLTLRPLGTGLCLSSQPRYRLPCGTGRVCFRIFGKGGKCRVGVEEGGMPAMLVWPLEGGVGVLPQKHLQFQMLRDRILCH